MVQYRVMQLLLDGAQEAGGSSHQERTLRYMMLCLTRYRDVRLVIVSQRFQIPSARCGFCNGSLKYWVLGPCGFVFLYMILFAALAVASAAKQQLLSAARL